MYVYVYAMCGADNKKLINQSIRTNNFFLILCTSYAIFLHQNVREGRPRKNLDRKWYYSTDSHSGFSPDCFFLVTIRVGITEYVRTAVLLPLAYRYRTEEEEE